MVIALGNALPHAKFKTMTVTGAAEVSMDELFKGKKAVLFAVPGAFTRPAMSSICRALCSTPQTSRRRVSI